jgi:transmembrane sensor
MIALSRAEILIERRFDDIATAAEESELDALLVAEGRVARLFVERASFEAELEAALRETTPGLIRASRPRLPRAWMAATGVVLLASLSVLFVARHDWHLPPTVAAVNFPDGSRASLQNGAKVSLRPGGTDLEVDLLGGAARFEVAHRAGHHFRVHVETVTVEVVGTSFEVRPGARDVAVTVARGRVHVTAPGRDAYLDAGMAARFSSDAPTTAAQPGTAHGTPRAVDPTDKDAALPREQASPRATPPAGSAWVRAAERKDYSGAYRVLSLVGIGTVRDDPSELLLAANVARLSGHPDQALSPLQRLLEGHARDPRAPYAAFILGRVLLEELHQPHDAALAFARVRKIDPVTPLASDALAREVLAWARAGDNDHARRRADEYVRAYPNGARLREILRFADTP